jgi:hypothetical protein
MTDCQIGDWRNIPIELTDSLYCPAGGPNCECVASELCLPSVYFRTPGSILGRALLIFASCHVVAKALARALFGNLSAELFSRWSGEVSRHEKD